MLETIFSLLFPQTNHEKTVKHTNYLIPKLFIVTVSDDTNILSCSTYKDKKIKSSIIVLKRTGSSKSSKLLSQLLCDTLLEEISDIDLWDKSKNILIPMPISNKRRRERGFNQMEKVFEKLPNNLQKIVSYNILTQTKNIPMQKGLCREDRLKNVIGTFSIINNKELNGIRVILVDDVTTTGATLTEAAKILRIAGAEVLPIALARA